MKCWCFFLLLFPLALFAQSPGGTFHVQTLSPNQGRLPQKAVPRGSSQRLIRYRPGCDSLVAVHAGGESYLHAVEMAFAGHYPFVFSPDHVWALILNGLCTHLQLPENSHLWTKTVRNRARTRIRVVSDSAGQMPVADSLRDWTAILAYLREETEPNLVPGFDSLTQLSFSTTGEFEQMSMDIRMLYGIKNQFDYMYIETTCGIPEVVLEGEAGDWRKIREQCTSLSAYELDWWLDDLCPVLDQFVAASEGRVDTTFWQSVFKQTMIPGTCGREPGVEGWIAVFFPYLVENIVNEKIYRNDQRVIVSLDSFPRSITVIEIPYQFETPLRQERQLWELSTGFSGMSQDPVSMAIRPEMRWSMRQGYHWAQLTPRGFTRQEKDALVLDVRNQEVNALTDLANDSTPYTSIHAENNALCVLPGEILERPGLDSLFLAGNQLGGCGKGFNSRQIEGDYLLLNANSDRQPECAPEAIDTLLVHFHYLDLRNTGLWMPPSAAENNEGGTEDPLFAEEALFEESSQDWLCTLAGWKPQHRDTIVVDLRNNPIQRLPESFRHIAYPLRLMLTASSPPQDISWLPSNIRVILTPSVAQPPQPPVHRPDRVYVRHRLTQCPALKIITE